VIQKKPLANIINITQTVPVNGHRPSVDVLFSSIGTVYGDECLAVIMTGMGKDGVKEIGNVYKHGGITIAQEESTCIVPGMPKAAIKKGYIKYIVPLHKIGDTIVKLVNEKS
jgi:two-component system chemotaxis response regulator CheB